MAEGSVQSSLDTNTEANRDPREMVMGTETESSWWHAADTQSEDYYSEVTATDSEANLDTNTESGPRPQTANDDSRSTTSRTTTQQVNEKLIQGLLQNQETADSLLRNSGPQESNKDSTANTEAEQGGQYPPQTSASQSGQTSNIGKNNVQEVVVESTEVDLTKRPNTAMPPTANQYGQL